MYGTLKPPLDEDETAAARLAPNFATLGIITRENTTYESVLAQSKQRWSRCREGNPVEQEQEWLEGEYLKDTNHDEVIVGNLNPSLPPPPSRAQY